MKALLNWLDSRTGYRAVLNDVLMEPVPGGARWRYVFGSTLVFAFMVQLITGIFLWAAYSPSAQTAWESVFFISYVMEGGWLLRGLHHFMAQAMIVLLGLHLVQVIWDGAYRAPREVNYWLGLILMQIVLGLSLTGYLLPWDQKGYWATRVATNLAGIVPVVGTQIQQLAVGGSEYGHHTLTRFFALHAGVLPGLLIGFVALHIYCFRFHGLTVPKHLQSRQTVTFWPDQVLKDAVACLVVLAVVMLMVIFLGGPGGAELGAPADPANAYSAARPEWYFLFLFQLLKYFPAEMEITEGFTMAGELVGALIIPGAVMLVLVLMPFIGRWRVGHWFNILFTLALIAGSGYLTYLAIEEDQNNKQFLASKEYNHHKAELVIDVALEKGIPIGGIHELMDQTAAIQGPEIFARNCAICHRVNGHDGTLQIAEWSAPDSVPNAADLGGFASKAWLDGLFDPDRVLSYQYWGGRKNQENDMVAFVTDQVAKYDEKQKAQLEKVKIALAAGAELPYEADFRGFQNADKQWVSAAEVIEEDGKYSADGEAVEPVEVEYEQLRVRDGEFVLKGQTNIHVQSLPRYKPEDIEAGKKILLDDSLGCLNCHNYQGQNEFAYAPDLTNYGSREWTIGLVHNVESAGEAESGIGAYRYYPDTNEGMPLFGQKNLLTRTQIEHVVDWLRMVPLDAERIAEANEARELGQAAAAAEQKDEPKDEDAEAAEDVEMDKKEEETKETPPMPEEPEPPKDE